MLLKGGASVVLHIIVVFVCLFRFDNSVDLLWKPLWQPNLEKRLTFGFPR